MKSALVHLKNGRSFWMLLVQVLSMRRPWTGHGSKVRLVSKNFSLVYLSCKLPWTWTFGNPLTSTGTVLCAPLPSIPFVMDLFDEDPPCSLSFCILLSLPCAYHTLDFSKSPSIFITLLFLY